MLDKLTVIVEFVQSEVSRIQNSVRIINHSRNALQQKYNSQVKSVDQKIDRLIASAEIASEHRALVKEKNDILAEKRDEIKRLDRDIEQQNKIVQYLVLRLQQLVEEAQNSKE